MTLATPTSNGELTDTQHAAARFFAGYWSNASPRNDAAAALAGGLLRNGWSVETVECFIGEVAKLADDDEAHKRVARVAETADAIKNDGKATGWPRLAKLLGADGGQVVRCLRVMLGLTIDLATLAADKQIPVKFLQDLGLHDLSPEGVGIAYKDGSGRTVAVKRRTALKAKDGSWWPLGKKLMAYGEERLGDGAAAGYRVLVEGESDCWSLWFHGFPALGLPGSNTVAKTLAPGHVFGVPVLYVVQETDGAGAEFVRAVAARLAELHWPGTLKVVHLDPHKDPNDLHTADPQTFPERFRQAMARAEVAPPAPPPAGGPKKPLRTIAPYVPFPVDALPTPLAEYVQQGAAALGCDPAYLALPVLTVAASLIGATRTIRLKREWHETAVIWSVIIGESGTLKSPAYAKAVSYLYRLHKRLQQEFKQRCAEYRRDLAEYKKAEQAFEDGEGEDPGDPPEKPTLQRVVCSDTTIEKLAQILEDSPRGTLVARDELAGWLGSFCRYKGKGGGSDLPNWLEMHRAGTVIVDRKTGERPHLFIERAAASVTGGIQPGVLARALTPEFFDAGLPARLLMAQPTTKQKHWTEAEIAEDVEKAYHAVLDGLLELDFGRNDEGECVPQALRLSTAAHAVWVAFYNAWAQEQVAVEGDLAACFSKLEAYAPRFALLHHVVTRVAQGENELVPPIGLESIQAGITLCKWFANEARRIYSTLTETQEERNTRHLVEFIHNRGRQITAKELQRSNSRKYPDADTAIRALDALAEAGYGHWQDRISDSRGGRPTRDFILHAESLPTIDDTDETSSDHRDRDTVPPAEASDETSDETPSPCDDTPKNTEETEVSSVSSIVGNNIEASTQEAEEASPGSGGFAGHPGGFVGDLEVSSGAAVEPSDPAGPDATAPVESLVTVSEPSNPTAWRLVNEQASLLPVLQAVDESVRVGLDTETTGLDPRKDRVRLLTLATDRGVWLVDCFALDPRPLWDLLAERPLIIHNATFDLGFLQRLGFTPGTVHDTILLSRLLHGTRHRKGFHGLEECVARELGRTLDKTQQKSDWSGALTAEQLAYASLDAALLVPLYEALDARIGDAGLTRVAEIERRCLPAVAWLSAAGVGFDATAWAVLAEEAREKAKVLVRDLDNTAPHRNSFLMDMGAWKWDSPAQVQEVFAQLGYSIERTNDDTLAGIDHPLAGFLRDYRAATKLVSTYGPNWCGESLYSGRIYAGWQQIGADSGRMACRSPNLQNLPRDKRYRRCFIAPDGRVLVKGDYSQIELRIAAKVSRDRPMLDAYRTGQDLHTLTAQQVLGITDVSPEHRQLAKAVNFGLLYGMGAKGFRLYAKSNYELDLTEEQATQYRDAFFQAYPGLRRWHRSIGNQPIATRTLAGRRRQNVKRYTEKLNTPIQGTGADGLKLALALLWERRAQCPGAFPVLVVHDEIVLECDADQAEAVARWLRQAMLDGMAPLIFPVPVEVETKIGKTWAG
jgi:DNA polymerase I-like protein with 3'-5' exonuclease and polymerase domains